MSTLLLEGPGRHVGCLSVKGMVDIARSMEEARQGRVVPHQQKIRERLTEELMRQTTLRPFHVASALTQQDEPLLHCLDQLTGALTPGHLALSQVADWLGRAQAAAARDGASRPVLETLAAQFRQRAARMEAQLHQQDLLTAAQRQCEQIMDRWRAGRYGAWSPAGRCYVALEELRWGAFGDAVRLGAPQARQTLLATLRTMACEQLAASVNASARTRHFYQQWLTTPPAPGLMDYKDTLSWLGDWSDGERHPITWSVTQSWQSVALGMPRLCSAIRLASAMVDEVFVA